MSDTPKTNPKSNQNSTIIAVVLTVFLIGGVAYYLNRSFYNQPNMMSMMNSSQDKSSQSNPSDSMMSMNGMDHSMMGMKMADMVKDDQSFLENMIPHHQEAVDTSKIIIAKTSDPELKQFAQNVIDAQTIEIDQMKGWYKTWFNKDYTSNATTSMMGDLSKQSGTELDKSYVKGMIMHHQGAIDMAKKIQTITQRDEIKQLADNIITSQTKEVTTLVSWMMSKYNDRSMMGM